MYYVLVCPDKYCRGVSIVKDEHETVTCRSCDSQYKFRKYKMSYKSDDREMAVKARTKLLVKINDSDLSFEDIEEQGYFEDTDKIYSGHSEKDTRSSKKIIRDQFKDLDKPTKEEVVERAVETSGIDEETAQNTLKKMIQQGMILNIGEKLELL